MRFCYCCNHSLVQQAQNQLSVSFACCYQAKLQFITLLVKEKYKLDDHFHLRFTQLSKSVIFSLNQVAKGPHQGLQVNWRIFFCFSVILGYSSDWQ